MTRADGPAAGFERRASARRARSAPSSCCAPAPTAMLDPDPAATAAARCPGPGDRALPDADLADPATFGGGDAAPRPLACALAELVRAKAGESPVGLVGVGRTGALALLLAAELGDAVDRLALVAVPAPETPIDRDDAELGHRAGHGEDADHERPAGSGCRGRRRALAPRSPPRLPGRDGAGVAVSSPDGRLAAGVGVGPGPLARRTGHEAAS